MEQSCWNGEPCHKRRTYYRHRDRYNRNRRLKYMGDKHSSAMLDGIDIPNIPAVVIHFYRQRKDEPLHALGIELWIGQQRKTFLQPVHTMGWTQGQVLGYIKDAIAQFSHKYLVQITGVAASVEMFPCLCPLLPCPLKIALEGYTVKGIGYRGAGVQRTYLNLSSRVFVILRCSRGC